MDRFTRRDIASLAASAALVAGTQAQADAGAHNSTKATEPIAGHAGAIPYSRFKLYNVHDADLDAVTPVPFPFVPGSSFRAVNTGIDEPAVQINFEDFLPGPDIIWSMFHDEVQYVTAGHAQITFHLPPLMQVSGTVIAGPGAIYLLPRGARITWRVLNNQPFRHLCVCVPNPGYPIPFAHSIAHE